jgi:hypothetical protein
VIGYRSCSEEAKRKHIGDMLIPKGIEKYTK